MGSKFRLKPDRHAQAQPQVSPLAIRRLPLTWRDWMVAAALVLLTFAVFGQVGSHQFLNYDDGQFIYENPHVAQGLTRSSITWAMPAAEIGLYPLTWLSHGLDIPLWGLRPGPPLLTSVGIHAVTACLLFFKLPELFRCQAAASGGGRQAIRGRPRDTAAWPAAFIAALFAIHPMHVESVAWISERKDTLSTLFIVIALLFYTRAPNRRLDVVLAMAASLAAKQMYVTFPFVLLLLDYWPLGRMRTFADFRSRIIEKLPLFALTIAGSVVAVIGQRNLKAVQTTESLSMARRFGNAAVAYCRYLAKLLFPVDLAVPYPLGTLTTTSIAGATLLLLAITAGAIFLRKRAPYIAVGWFWFVGTLVPVIGIVALGAQSMADRYSYFSYIGLFMAITFAALALPVPRQALAAAGAIVVLACAALGFHQTGYWTDSETLFAHTIAVTPPNAVAEYSLGQALELKKPDASAAHLRRAIELTETTLRNRLNAPPRWYAQAHVGLGTTLLMKARNESTNAARVALIHDALQQFETALKFDPAAPHSKNNIIFAQAMLGNAKASVPTRSEYDAAIDRGLGLLNRGDARGAIAAFQQVLDLQPRSTAGHVYLALGLLRAQRGREAAEALRAAKAIDTKQANDFITKAFRMPPGPANIDMVIRQAAAQ